jgi:hypothetical protein
MKKTTAAASRAPPLTSVKKASEQTTTLMALKSASTPTISRGGSRRGGRANSIVAHTRIREADRAQKEESKHSLREHANRQKLTKFRHNISDRSVVVELARLDQLGFGLPQLIVLPDQLSDCSIVLGIGHRKDLLSVSPKANVSAAEHRNAN